MKNNNCLFVYYAFFPVGFLVGERFEIRADLEYRLVVQERKGRHELRPALDFAPVLHCLVETAKTNLQLSQVCARAHVTHAVGAPPVTRGASIAEPTFT